MRVTLRIEADEGGRWLGVAVRDGERGGEPGIAGSSDDGRPASIVLLLELRRCPGTKPGSSGRGGRLDEGGGLGDVRESRKARCATEVRNNFCGCGADTDEEGFSDGNRDATGAGGGACVGAGRGGGIDRRLAATILLAG